jgi:exonuclease III
MIFYGESKLNCKCYNPGNSKAIYTTELIKGNESSIIQHSLRIYHQNICGLKYKVNELLSFLYPDFPHICMTEHHLNYIELSSTAIENYKLGASYCRRSASKGGTCIFLLNHINYVTLNTETNCSDFDIELCSVKIKLDSSYIYILSVYRAPSSNFSYFMHKMDKILRLLYNTKTEYIICGDFNIYYLIDNCRKSQFNSLLNSYNLFSIVDFPTRIQNTYTSTIDNIFLDYSRLGTFKVTRICNGISDHDAQLVLLLSFPKVFGRQEKLIHVC